MCKELATLRHGFDLPYTLNEISKQKPNYEQLILFFKDLDFYSILKKIEKESIQDANEVKKEEVEEKELDNFIVATNDYDFSNLTESVIVCESFKENYYNDGIIGIGIISTDLKYKIFVSSDVLFNNISLKKYLESDNKKYTFDYKKLYVVLKVNGINLNNVVYDALLASYLVNPAYANEDIKVVLENFESVNINYDENIYGYKQKAKIPEINIMATHSINKCIAILNTKDIILNEIKALNQEELLDIELNLSSILGDMEITGLKVDKEVLEKVGEELLIKQKEIEQKIYNIAQEEFNINSVKQLGEILFEKLKLPVVKKTKSGYSTDVDVLEKLKEEHPVIEKILEYRQVVKLNSTYVEGLKPFINPQTKRIHSFFHQTI